MNRISDGIKISMLMLIALAVISTGAIASTIDSCTNINSPGEYVLNKSITNSIVLNCIEITSSDVVFDGAGYIIDGIDAQDSKGVYVYNSENVTVKNVTATDWYNGIFYLKARKGFLVNNNLNSNHLGIVLKYSSNNTLIKNNANSNTLGIYFNYSDSNTITSNIASMNSHSGLRLLFSRNNTIYNNIFNNTNNTTGHSIGWGGGGGPRPVYRNYWNITKTAGENIVGGPYLGGNFWALPNGTGYSQTCADSDRDGICDYSYKLSSINIDYLPIAPLIHVSIEIDPDHINPRSRGEIKVTIFNTTPPGFDVESVNISSVRFGHDGTEAKAIRNQTADKKLMLWFNTQDTGIQCGDTQATLTGRTYTGFYIIGIDGITTVGCEGGGDGVVGSGPGTGGGGVVTPEPYDNIAKFERRDGDLVANKPVTYSFTSPELAIYQVVITGRENENNVAVRVESLKGTSKLVKIDAPGNVYTNENVWAGSKRIGDVLVRFRVKNSWIETNNVARTEIQLLNWSGSEWNPLESRMINKDDNYTYFESKTTGLSLFAISGLKGEVRVPSWTPVVTMPVETPPAEKVIPTPTKTKAPGFEIAAVIAVTLVVYRFGKKGY